MAVDLTLDARGGPALADGPAWLLREENTEHRAWFQRGREIPKADSLSSGRKVPLLFASMSLQLPKNLESCLHLVLLTLIVSEPFPPASPPHPLAGGLRCPTWLLGIVSISPLPHGLRLIPCARRSSRLVSIIR